MEEEWSAPARISWISATEKVLVNSSVPSAPLIVSVIGTILGSGVGVTLAESVVTATPSDTAELKFSVEVMRANR